MLHSSYKFIRHVVTILKIIVITWRFCLFYGNTFLRERIKHIDTILYIWYIYNMHT